MDAILERYRSLRLPIGYKLVALFLVVTLAALGATTALTRNRVRDDELKMARAAQEARVSNTARLLDEHLQGLVAQMVVAGNLPTLREFALGCPNEACKERARASLTALQEQDSYIESVAVINLEGVLSLSNIPSEEGTNLKFRPYFLEAAKGNTHISDVSISAITGQPVLFVSAPIKSVADQALGVVRIRIQLGGIIKRITDEASLFGDGTETMLVDQYGLRLAMSDPAKNVSVLDGGLLLTGIQDVPEDVRKQWVQEKRFGAKTSDQSIVINAQPTLAAAITGDKGTREIEYGGARREASVASLQLKPWKYVATVPSSLVTASTDATMNRVTLIGLIAAAVAAIVAFLFAQTVTRPIVKLARVADAISTGQTDVSIDDGANDELGDLATAIRRMVASVRYYMSKTAEGRTTAGTDESTPAA